MRKFIFETDWFTDVDDCIALRFLCRSLDDEHKLLGINVNSPSPYAYASIKAFLKDCKKDAPIALDFDGKYEGEDRYQKEMAEGENSTNADAEDTLTFYKRILEENDEIEILSVGFLNSLEKVYKAYPELFKKKVKKIWCMAGKWDEDGGKEWNIRERGYSLPINSSRFIINDTDLEIVFLGGEVGKTVLTANKLDKNDMLYKAICAYGVPNGRCSWDPMLVMLAYEEEKYQGSYGYVKGVATIDEEGKNHFVEGEGRHSYVVKLKPDSYYEDLINEVIR